MGGGTAKGHPSTLRSDVGMVAVAKATAPRVKMGGVGAAGVCVCKCG